MNKLFNLIAQGALSIADSYVSPREYVKLSRNGFQQDQARLRSDVERVGVNMSKVIARHGKQPNKSPVR